MKTPQRQLSLFAKSSERGLWPCLPEARRKDIVDRYVRLVARAAKTALANTQGPSQKVENL
jgi:hypothetical protein